MNRDIHVRLTFQHKAHKGSWVVTIYNSGEFVVTHGGERVDLSKITLGEMNDLMRLVRFAMEMMVSE
jgi:hypothetical protein